MVQFNLFLKQNNAKQFFVSRKKVSRWRNFFSTRYKLFRKKLFENVAEKCIKPNFLGKLVIDS